MQGLASVMTHLWHMTFLGSRGRGASQLPIDLGVVDGHAGGGKPPLKASAHPAAIERQDAADFADGLVDAVDHLAGNATVDHFRHGAVAEGENRCSAGHGLNHDQAERLRPIDWKKQRTGVTQELVLTALVDLTDVVDARQAEQWFDFGFEVLLVNAIDLGSDLERKADSARDLNGTIYALFRRDASEVNAFDVKTFFEQADRNSY